MSKSKKVLKKSRPASDTSRTTSTANNSGFQSPIMEVDAETYFNIFGYSDEKKEFFRNLSKK